MESNARKLMAGALIKRIVAFSCLFVSGCTPPSLYYWGEYEDMIYQMYSEPGSADPATQIAKIREDIGIASESGKQIPPGLHAHLGYMYYLQGDTQSAFLEFAAEKQLFPESAIFIDGLMSRIKQ
ncbi:MAG: DUF4810 domain-containing protein [Methylicorpusculum sp.]|nr:DUF4810 domain-containing protein [Methylicorpusculum sp.]